MSRPRHLNGGTISNRSGKALELVDSAAVAAARTAEQSAGRVERRVGNHELGRSDHSVRCPRDTSLEAGQGDGEGNTPETRAARLSTIVAVAAAMLAVVVVLAHGGDRRTGGTKEGQQECRGSGNTNYVWWVTASWSGVAAASLSLVLSAMAVVLGSLWCVARVARWREEIFAGSPVVGEALSRVAALDRDENQDEERQEEEEEDENNCSRTDGRGDCAERDRNTSSNARRAEDFPQSKPSPSSDKESIQQDPIGNLFGPGTRASREFSTPNSATATATEAVTAEDGGAVVFLTGVTGLVGQMVLFDLLKQGAAASAIASAEKEQGRTERRGLGTKSGSSNSEDGTAGGRDGEGKSIVGGGLRRVIVLVRSKKGVSPAERLASIRESAMFRPLRESGAWTDDAETPPADANDIAEAPRKVGEQPRGSERNNKARGGVGGTLVTAVEGELGKEGLGLTAESRALLARAGVTHAMHCAASVSFSDPLEEAAATNVTGALRVAALVACWPSCG